jgi:low affinity Fe/Cu permease
VSEHQLAPKTGGEMAPVRVVALLNVSPKVDSSLLQASNRMIGIESLDEQALQEVAAFYVGLAERAKATGTHKETHSIDEEGMPCRGDLRIKS